MGKTRLNGFWKHVISKISIESTGNRWNSSGKNFPGFTTLGILAEIQKMMAELRCDPEHFQGKIIFISMYIDIEWWTPGNKENCVANAANVATYAKKFLHGCWSFLGHLLREKVVRNSYQQTKWWMGQNCWRHDAQLCWERASCISCHQRFRKRRIKKKKKAGGKTSFHFNGSEETVESILRTVISVNQLTIYGAVADMRKELDPDSRKQTEGEICESLVADLISQR